MTNVVAAMGVSLSARQQALLSERFTGVTILFDGDQAGREGNLRAATSLVGRMWVRVVECPEGLQPDGLSAEDLKELLQGVAQRYPGQGA